MHPSFLWHDPGGHETRKANCLKTEQKVNTEVISQLDRYDLPTTADDEAEMEAMNKG